MRAWGGTPYPFCKTMRLPSLAGLFLTPTGTHKNATPNHRSDMQPSQPSNTPEKKTISALTDRLWAQPNRVEELPFALRELITQQLIRRDAADPALLCDTLRQWCKAHPQACGHESIWREAFALAFGQLAQPDRTGLWPLLKTWKDAFLAVCAALKALPTAEERQTWAQVATWKEKELDKQLHVLRAVPEFELDAREVGGGVQNIAVLTRLLLARGASVERCNLHAYLSDLLIHEVAEGDEEEVKSLLARGAWADYIAISPNLAGDGTNHETALFYAARTNRMDIACVLLEEGADKVVNVQAGSSAEYPLLVAIMSGHINIAMLLLQHGASPNIRNTLAVGEGWTPLMFAARKADGALLDALLEAGAETKATDPDGQTARELASVFNTPPEQADIVSRLDNAERAQEASREGER